jgi:signal peptidase
LAEKKGNRRVSGAWSDLRKKLKSSSAKEVIEFGIVIAIVVVTLVGVNVGLQVGLNTPIPVVVVDSGSMVPTLNVGDICIIKNVSADEYVVGNHLNRNGDIIVWNANGLIPAAGGEPVIHRIVGSRYDNATGRYEFLTQGDNFQTNSHPDVQPNGSYAWFDQGRVYGKVILTIPWVGNIFLLLKAGGVWLVVLALVVLIIYVFVDETSKMQKAAKKKLESEGTGSSRRAWV